MDIQNPDFDSFAEEAQNKNTSEKRLKELAYLNVNLARLVANNPAASSELLQQLFYRRHRGRLYDVKTSNNVLSNPNAPVKILITFANQYERFEEEAKNHNTSEERLREIAASNIYLAEIVASNPATPGKLLQELSQQSINLAKIVASNPMTPAEILRQMASKRKDSTIRKNITANPNTPIDVLLKLGEKFPGQLLNNPIWSLLLLENSNLLNIVPKNTLISLLQYDLREHLIINTENNKKLIPEFWFKKLVKSKSYRIRCYIARHPITSVDLLEELVEDKHSSVRCNVALNVNTTFNLLEKLVVDFDGSVRKQVASNSKTPVYLLEKLINDEYIYVRYRVAEHPKINSYLLDKLASDNDSNVRLKVAINAKTSIKTLIRLAEDGLVKYSVVQNPNLPGYLLEHFAYSEPIISTYSFHKAIASNINTPSHVLEKLALKIIHDLDTERYCNYLDPNGKSCLTTISYNPNTPAYILENLAISKRCYKREIAARSPYTPIAALEKLAEDEDVEVIRGIACNPTTPANLLEKLVYPSRKWGIRKAIEEHPNNPRNNIK